MKSFFSKPIVTSIIIDNIEQTLMMLSFNHDPHQTLK